MAEPAVKEGEVPFDVPAAGKSCNTWYKVFGDLSNGKPPLVLLHGGPGACHDYLLPFVDITRQYDIPTIFYDQVGNGKSTRLPERMGDTDFWTIQLFHNELNNLIDALGIREGGFNILGQSWGGMLGSSFATQRPKGLRHLVIANSPASMELWVESGRKLLDAMPQVRDTINHYEGLGEYESEDYKKAIEVLYAKHLCRAEPWPAPEVKSAMDHLEEDMTVYMTMNGPSELSVTGSLKTWSIIEELHKIEVPTLLLNGEHDEAQDSCVVPYFQHIQKVKWVVIEDASHMSHVEKRERSMRLVGGFLSY